MKGNRTMTLLSVLCLLVITIGSTFAFFTASVQGDKDLELSSYKFALNLNLDSEFVGPSLIPIYDKDILKGYNQSCKDDLNRRVCISYKIVLENDGDSDTLEGLLDLDLVKVQNLSYMVLDSSKNEFQATTKVNDGKNLSLGGSFDMNKGDVKTFYLIIWLTDTGDIQDNIDADGTFSGSVTYQSTHGRELVGTILNGG